MTNEGVAFDIRPNQILENMMSAAVPDAAVPDTRLQPAETNARVATDTLRRMEAQNRAMQADEPDYNDAFEDIAFALAHKDGAEARALAEQLAVQMQRSAGSYAEWTAVDILKFVMRRVKKAPEQPQDSGTVIPIDVDGDDEDLKSNLSKKVDWISISTMYGLENDEAAELENIGTRLLKKGEDDSAAFKSAKDVLGRARKKKKRNKFKNPQHLLKAVMDAIRRKKDGRKVTKPVKPNEEPDADDQAA